MNRLWAPWRIGYIRKKPRKTCVFCRDKRHIIFKTAYSLAMLNIFPYNNGHLMVAPLRHIKGLDQLEPEEALDLFEALRKAQRLLDKTLKPEGYNIGINIGRSGGAGIPRHLHIHIVPRWKGDANFMPITTNTKIISQSLEDLYKQLKHAQSKTN